MIDNKKKYMKLKKLILITRINYFNNQRKFYYLKTSKSKKFNRNKFYLFGENNFNLFKLLNKLIESSSLKDHWISFVNKSKTPILYSLMNFQIYLLIISKN